MNKHQRYRQKCISEGRCPHCGKPCAPYYTCEERRNYKKKKASKNHYKKHQGPRPKGKTIRDFQILYNEKHRKNYSYNKIYYLIKTNAIDFEFNFFSELHKTPKRIFGKIFDISLKNLDCEKYNECLNLASKNNWNGWICVDCAFYLKRISKDMDYILTNYYDEFDELNISNDISWYGD